MEIIHTVDKVTLVGALSVGTVGPVRIALHKAVERFDDVFPLDVSRVTIRDSHGLSALVGALRLAERQGKVCALINPPLSLKHQLARVGVLRLFSIIAAPDQAVQVPHQSSRTSPSTV